MSVVLVQVISDPGESVLDSTAAQEPQLVWPEQVGERYPMRIEFGWYPLVSA
jgi:hypothetical protein